MDPSDSGLTRGQIGRRLARCELVVGGVVVFVVQPFLFIAAPETIGPMFPGKDWQPELFIGAIAAQLAALGLMLRWYRSDPEPDQHAWRYRAD